MNLKDFFDNKNGLIEPYWSLVIEPGWVQAGIWRVINGGVNVDFVSPASRWELENNLIDACDSALSTCINSLPEGSKEPTKTVFGVASSWVAGGEIKPEYLEKIKQICEKLSLVPAGFVVLTEAVSHLIKQEEGTPANAVIVGLYDEEIEISVFSLGNLLGTTSVSRSVSIVDDVIEGLTRLATDTPFPSRIIIFDGKEGQLEEGRDSLMSKNWDEEESIKFLHSPKVEILSTDKKVHAVSLAGASEIEGIDNFAVVESNDIPEELGFTQLTEEEPVQSFQEPEVVEESFPRATIDNNFVETAPTPVFTPNLPRKKLTLNMPKFDFDFSRFSAPKLKLPKLGFIVGGVLGFILLINLYWWFLSHATISIYVSPQKVTKDLAIVLSADNSKTVEGSFESEKTTNTTGKKLVGDRSKGSVKIQNGTSSPINVAAGSVLISSGDLRFTVDQSASVSGALSPSSPGTATVAVTASAIGSEYNLAKDEVFKVGNYPKAEVDATSTADFSGGSSREVSAVSQADLTKLDDELRPEIEEKIKNDLSSQVGGDEVIISTPVESTDATKKYSKTLGEEGDSVSLNLKLEASYLVIKRDALLEKITAEVSGMVPKGYVLRPEQIDYTFGEFGEDEEEVEVNAIVNLLPEVNEDDIKNKIKGKKLEVVEKYLGSFESYTKVYIALKPKLLSFFSSLPKLAKNIEIEIIADR